MKTKQVLVNIAIIAVLTAVAFFCYTKGKASIIYVENLPFEFEGKSYPAFEAIDVGTGHSSASIYLMEGDRDVLSIVGKSHVLVIEEFDENDNIVQTYQIKFKSSELKGQVINIVPLANGKIPGWSYPLD